jgi:hypothetical protein
MSLSNKHAQVSGLRLLDARGKGTCRKLERKHSLAGSGKKWATTFCGQAATKTSPHLDPVPQHNFCCRAV